MKNWFLWLLAGVLSLIGGFMALSNPFAATLTAEMLTGWMFLISGAAVMVSAFADKSKGRRIMAVLVGVFMLLLGVFLLNNPLKGIVSLTYLAALMLVFTGAARLLTAFKTQGGARWALVVSGILSWVLAGMIFGNFAGAAVSLLGLLLAIELISNGVSMIMLSLQARQIKSVNR